MFFFFFVAIAAPLDSFSWDVFFASHCFPVVLPCASQNRSPSDAPGAWSLNNVVLYPSPRYVVDSFFRPMSR